MGLYAGEILIDYILLHSTAHSLQVPAVFLQQSGAEGFSHSAAQATQSSAQSLQSAPENDEPLASNLAHRAQMSAQSRQSAIDFKWFLSFKVDATGCTFFTFNGAYKASVNAIFRIFHFIFIFIFFFSSAVVRSSGSLLPDYLIYLRTINTEHFACNETA